MQIIVFIFLCIVWGTTWVAIKVSLEGLPPFFGAASRFSLALILLFAFIRIRGVSLKMNRRDFRFVFISAFLMYTLDYGLIYWGEQYLSAGVTAIFFATFPLFTAIWSNFLFHSEKFNWYKFLGLVLGFCGILVVFYDQLLQTNFHTKVILGSLAIIFGAMGGAMAVVIVKKHLFGVNPLKLSFHQMLQGAFFLFGFGFIMENVQTIQLNGRVVFAVFYLGAIGSALAFALYYWLLQQMSAITLSLIIYITPIVAILVDYLVLGEVIQRQAIIGMFIIFAGITLTQFGQATKLRVHFKRRKPAVKNK
ncbi:MAG: EamA family transporter [Calditrichia bacterium]